MSFLSLTTDRVTTAYPEQPLIVAPDATIATVLQLMKTQRSGNVLVCEDGPGGGGPECQVLGIFTERDVLNLCAENRTDFARTSIRPCMTCDITTSQPEETISIALTVMTAKRFRHLPVVEDGKLIGVVSIGDLVKAKLEETAQEAQALREYITS